MAQPLADAMQTLGAYRTQRISVVTKQDNRFEGILKGIRIDTQDICMEKVRFCGTECRRVVGSARPARMELISDVTFRLEEIKEIFAHIEHSPEMCMDPAVSDMGHAITPIFWTTVRLPNNKEVFVLPTPPDQRVVERPSPTDKNPLLNISTTVKVLTEQMHRSVKPQTSFISAGNIRYEGTLKDVDPMTKSVSLTSVRFWGTEDRPATKPAEPRAENYPSVKFQLDQLKYIRISVAMCQDMFEDTAVMVDESSHGIIEIDADNPLPTALQTATELPPRNVKAAGGAHVPDSAPSDGDHSSTSTAPVDRRLSRVRFRSTDSRRTVSPRSGRSATPPAPSTSASPAERAKSQPPALDVADGVHRRSGSMTPAKTFGFKRARGRPPSAGRQTGILKKVATSSPNKSAVEVFSDVSEADSDRARDDRVKNACPEPESAASETVVFDIMWIDRYMQCPVAGCSWRANNLYVMKCHFEKRHCQQYPQHQLRLCCSECPESGFKGQIPTLRKHMESVHHWTAGYPRNEAPELNENAAETGGASGEEPPPAETVV